MSDVRDASDSIDSAHGGVQVGMMNRISFCLLVACCVNSFGQTNSASPSAKLFSLSGPALRTAMFEKETPMEWSQSTEKNNPKSETQFAQTDLTLTLDTSDAKSGPPPEPMSLETRERALMLKYHERLKQTGYLTRPEPPSDNLLIRIADSTFRPEVFKIGKASVSCSIVTAIKRMNPLCLLNPFVLGISW
jgi:hypothetical protein